MRVKDCKSSSICMFYQRSKLSSVCGWVVGLVTLATRRISIERTFDCWSMMNRNISRIIMLYEHSRLSSGFLKCTQKSPEQSLIVRSVYDKSRAGAVIDRHWLILFYNRYHADRSDIYCPRTAAALLVNH